MMLVGEPAVVEAELVKDRGVKIGDPHSVLDRTVAEIVGGAVNVASLEAAAREPQTESVAVVVTSRAVLRNRQTAKFPAPPDDRAFQQAAALQIMDQPMHGQFRLACITGGGFAFPNKRLVRATQGRLPLRLPQARHVSFRHRGIELEARLLGSATGNNSGCKEGRVIVIGVEDVLHRAATE